MKCLKNTKTGNIVRVTDIQANQMVGSQWQYVSKSEWKAVTRIVKEEKQSEVVVEEKQPRPKFKKGKKQ